MIKNWIILILPIISTILGIILGSLLTYKTGILSFYKQKRIENRILAYSRLMSLKVPWAQFIQTNVEAKLLCEFYETRYLLFTKNEQDLLESKKQNERALCLIKDISEQQKQVFETLGLIQISFKMNDEIEKEIDELFHFQSIDVKEFPKSFKTEQDLQFHFDEQNGILKDLLQTVYKDRIDRILILLKKEINKGQRS